MKIARCLAEVDFTADRHAIDAVDKIKADIAAGRDELVPADVVKRIVDGETPRQVWRSDRGLSARDLAAALGFSAPYISEIESGKKEGSVSAVKKIADALRVDRDDLAWNKRCRSATKPQAHAGAHRPARPTPQGGRAW